MLRNVMIGVTAIVVAACWVGSVTGQTEQAGAFGFADTTGQFVLVDTLLAHPVEAVTAFCALRPELSVSHDGRQTENVASDGRAVGYNFSNMPGIRYRVVGPVRPAPNTSCFVASQDFAIDVAHALNHNRGSCADDMVELARERYARGVLKCERIARWSGGSVSGLQFDWVNGSGLAAILLTTGADRWWWELPATQRISAWRVDDDGEFFPRDFTALIAVRSGGLTYLGLEWAAAEGAVLRLLRTEPSGGLEIVGEGYRYWMPR